MRDQFRVECACVALESAVNQTLLAVRKPIAKLSSTGTYKAYHKTVHLSGCGEPAELDLAFSEGFQETKTPIRRNQARETDQRDKHAEIRPAESFLDDRPDEGPRDAVHWRDDTDENQCRGGHMKAGLCE